MVLSDKNTDKFKYPPMKQVSSCRDLFRRWVFFRFGATLFLVFIVILFPSCGKQRTINEKKSLFILRSVDRHIPDYALFNEAKYSDLPIPIGFYFVEKGFVDIPNNFKKSDYLSYEGNSSIIDIINFYTKALEREGWDINDLSNEYEGLFVCSKPIKNLVVSIRRIKKNKINVSMFVQNVYEKNSYRSGGSDLKKIQSTNFVKEEVIDSSVILNSSSGLNLSSDGFDKNINEPEFTDLTNINSKSISEYRLDSKGSLNFGLLKKG